MIQRVPEPELMDDIDQVAAYAAADFNSGDDHTLSLILSLVRETVSGAPPRRVIDLGCGPGNITLRLCDAFPESEVIGVDGAAAMLHLARARAATPSRHHIRVDDLQVHRAHGRGRLLVVREGGLHRR